MKPNKDDDPPEPDPLRVLVVHTTSAVSSSSGPRREEADRLDDTAYSVAQALRARGHVVDTLPISDSLEPVARDAARFDVVFNLVDSIGQVDGREPELPELLDELGVPCTGCSARALRAAFGKDLLRKHLEDAGVRVPRSFVVTRLRDRPARPAGESRRARPSSTAGSAPNPDAIAWPRFVKPARVDGSIGIDQGSVVHDTEAQDARVRQLFEAGLGPVLVEEYLPGPELNLAVLGQEHPQPCAVTVMDFSQHPAGMWPIITYDCKWVTTSPEYVGASVDATGHVSEELIAEARRLGLAALGAIGAHGTARVDLRANGQGELAVLDVNPNPDLDPDAGFARAMRLAGYSYEDLVEHMVHAAARAGHRKAAPWTSAPISAPPTAKTSRASSKRRRSSTRTR